MTDIDPLALAELRIAVQRCGIASDRFEISYEDELQSVEIRILGSSLSDAQIESLLAIQQVHPFPIVTFVAPEMLARSSAILGERYQRKAREWLRKQGLLERLPQFNPEGEQPLQFAQRLEEFCGIAPGSVFEINEQLNVVTPKASWIGKPLRSGWIWRKLRGKQHQQQFECLMRAMSAVNAEDYGIRFGFVGNGYMADEEPS